MKTVRIVATILTTAALCLVAGNANAYNGTTAAEIQANADTWSLLGQIQNGKIVPARPENTILVTARVVNTPQGLRISDFSWKFAPGSAP